MNKLDLNSKDIAKDNIQKIAELFPDCVAENEKQELKVDFDKLQEALGGIVLDENTREKYEMTWPGKKAAKQEAVKRINKTLRPLKDKSVDFDNTKNIYIEGHNVEALKILQESYLGKIKCIYIDPPYNTGHDFIYNDNFTKTKDEEMRLAGEIDEDGNRLTTNSESNSRFHSDWLSSIFPCLKLARNLLSDDGAIFISIDDTEQANLRKLCDEVFGESNFINCFLWFHGKGKKDSWSRTTQQYMLAYAKNKNELSPWVEKSYTNYEFSNPDNDPKGKWFSGSLSFSESRSNPLHPNYFEITSPTGVKWKRQWQKTEEEIEALINDGDISWGDPKKCDGVPRQKIRPSMIDIIPSNSINDCGTTRSAQAEVSKIFGSEIFDYPKPVALLKKIFTYFVDDDFTVLDFYSGSATTAHAVMELNSEDSGKRNFILVQYNENLDDNLKKLAGNTQAQATTKNAIKFLDEIGAPHRLCEIGEERIRRAAKKIKEETNADIDYGFRVYKVDSSNIKDVNKTPSDLLGNMESNSFLETIDSMESNIKEDRTPEDLLTQVILNLGGGIDLSSKIEEKEINGKKVFFVDGTTLIACFDENVDMSVIEEIAKQSPIKAVFRDSSFKTDSDRINVEETFKAYSAKSGINTEVVVL